MDEVLDKIRRLIELGAGEFEHVDMPLMAHLDGTRCLLKSWGARAALQQAGLFHQAYFKGKVRDYRLVDTAQRSLIAEIIGAETENIVYHYCACDRDILSESVVSYTFPHYVDRYKNQAQTLSVLLWQDLSELFVATELEFSLRDPQKNLLPNTHFRAFLDKMLPYLSRGAGNKVKQLLRIYSESANSAVLK